MNESISTLQLVFGAVVAIGVIVGGFWALLMLAMKQFDRRLDDRFRAQDQARLEGRKEHTERLFTLEDRHHELERAHMKLLAELPREYVRREDHIRFETVITAKLDALNAEIRLLAERYQLRS